MSRKASASLTIEQIRRKILLAIYADDVLMEVMVLKGGNALSLVYGVGNRSSVDLDFSIARRFDDTEEASRRIFSSLDSEFGAVGYTVFDHTFERKPSVHGQNTPDWWGGYQIKFKLIRTGVLAELNGDWEKIRRRAEVVGPEQLRTYTIDISHSEYVTPKIEAEVDDYRIFVYSPEMIVAEKLRAICQQLPEYPLITTKRRRARDFYDIYQVVTRYGFDVSDAAIRALLQSVFEAKAVPLDLMQQVVNARDFHEEDWASVVVSITGEHRGFSFYFDFVVDLCRSFQSTRDV